VVLVGLAVLAALVVLQIRINHDQSISLYAEIRIFRYTNNFTRRHSTPLAWSDGHIVGASRHLQQPLLISCMSWLR